MDEPVKCPQKPSGNSPFKRWISALIDFIQSLSPRSGDRFINVKKLHSGSFIGLNINAIMEYISAAASPGTSESESTSTGYFMAVDTSTTTDGTTTFKIKIIDGDNEDNTICGRAITDQTHNIEPLEFTITESGVIVIKVYYDEDNEVYTVTLEQLSEFPDTFPENTYYIEICSYTLADSTLTISQTWRTGTVYVGAYCWI